MNRKDPQNCYICKSDFKGTLKDIPKHFEEVHPGKGYYKCSLCDVTFMSLTRRHVHIKEKHAPEGIH